MKPAAIAILLLAFTSAAHAAPLIDFSEGPSVALSPLYPAQESKILGQLFTSYVKDYAKCPAGDAASGTEVILSDVQAIRGNFSSLSQDDLVLIFKSVDCNGGHAGEHANVALVRNGAVIDARQDLSTELAYKTLDTDADGLLEVIATASYSNMGYSGRWAQTITFKGGQAREISYVQGTVHYDDCGLDGKTEGEYDAVFFAGAAGAQPEQKNYRRACGADAKGFKFYSSGKLDKEL
ncbi:MAG: hypothetical protein EOP11_06890 [Proteobacteria bacterium]|nr:MAG: hypothetical protein EOP11_06890 [Pseudomonadota bacterium]